MTSISCERCGRPARVHETVIENGHAVERHFCRQHGQRLWFAACHGPLAKAVAELAAEPLPAGLAHDQLKAPSAAARTLGQARAAFRQP